MVIRVKYVALFSAIVLSSVALLLMTGALDQPLSVQCNRNKKENATVNYKQFTTDAAKDIKKLNPKIELMVRVSTVNSAGKNLMGRFFCMLMRTLVLYWSPIYGDTVVVIMDGESKEDHRVAKILEKKKFDLIRPVVKFEPLPENPKKLAACPDPNHGDFGYKRQLYSSFFMDRYSSVDVVGWIDTDIIFTSPAMPSDVIRNGRVVVYGASSRMKHGWVLKWFQTVNIAIGYPAVADCMTYFPTYFWRDTFSNFRNFAMKRFNTKSFDEAFYEIYQLNILSPVNIICNYAWHYERDRYDWHLDLAYPAFSNYYKVTHKNILNVKPGDTSMKLHHAFHNSNPDGLAKPGTDYLRLTQITYCKLHQHVYGSSKKICDQFKDTVFLKHFEFSDETWCKGKDGLDKCKKMIEDNYRRLAPLVKNGTFPFNISLVKNLEKTAKSLNISCPSLGL